MQTFKEILGRENERFNLKNVLLCTAVVLVLVLVGYGVSQMDLLMKGSTEVESREPAVTVQEP